MRNYCRWAAFSQDRGTLTDLQFHGVNVRVEANVFDDGQTCHRTFFFQVLVRAARLDLLRRTSARPHLV